MKRKQTITDREYEKGLDILSAHASNQTGADKTWVLHALRRLERLFKSARLVTKKRHGSVR
jgi:hypothetical protein